MTSPTTAPRATELECQETIVHAAMAAGWLVHAQRAARTAHGWRTTIQGHTGFPDLVLVTPDCAELHIVELKRRPNRLEPDQHRWRAALTAVSAAAGDRHIYSHVWWVPDDLQRCLEFITHRGRR
jgi:hypothetical protein